MTTQTEHRFAVSTFRTHLIALLLVILVVGVTSALMWAARQFLVQPESLAAACAAGQGGWQCWLREQLVLGFTRNVFGMTALVAGVLATVSRWRILAVLAIVSGVAGAMLYRYELAGAGLLLGALVLLRSPTDVRQKERDGE
jgi:hypothetical protein